jgi:hypothetical protein
MNFERFIQRYGASILRVHDVMVCHVQVGLEFFLHVYYSRNLFHVWPTDGESVIYFI